MARGSVGRPESTAKWSLRQQPPMPTTVDGAVAGRRRRREMHAQWRWLMQSLNRGQLLHQRPRHFHPQGDIAETRAIRPFSAWHARNHGVSSTKGATGHMLGAAGAGRNDVCAKTCQTDIVPPTPCELQVPDPGLRPEFTCPTRAAR